MKSVCPPLSRARYLSNYNIIDVCVCMLMYTQLHTQTQILLLLGKYLALESGRQIHV